MTTDPVLIATCAAELLQAARTRTPVRQLSQRFPQLTIDDAYAIQWAWTQLRRDEGRVVQGRKIGLTSRAMQQAVNIDEPDYGVLLDDMFFADGDDIPLQRFIAPRVEVELAFMLARPLHGPNCTLADVLAAVEYVVPALEVLDARVQMTDAVTGTGRTIVDTIADNAADAAIVVSTHRVRPEEVDLRWVSALLYRDGVIEESGVAAAVLDHPANGVAWLANKLHAHGAHLAAGELILAGSFTRPVWVTPQSTFHADYGPLGTITCRFA